MTFVSQNVPRARVLDPVALLVDGENLSSGFAAALLDIAQEYGVPTVRRVYGKAEQIIGWEQEGYRLMPTRPGKNAADLLLSVEAMSLALRDGFHTLLIASSDRDFVYLFEHLRELGHQIVGIGEGKAPGGLRKACSRFEELPAVPAPVAKARPMAGIIPQIRKILPQSKLPDGWATVTWLEQQLLAGDPGFEARAYGGESLAAIVTKLGCFETRLGSGGGLLLRDLEACPAVPVGAVVPALAARPTVKPVSICSSLDQRLLAGIGKDGLEMANLNNVMKGQTVVAQTGHKTWRAYLETKPELYAWDGTKLMRAKGATLA